MPTTESASEPSYHWRASCARFVVCIRRYTVTNRVRRVRRNMLTFLPEVALLVYSEICCVYLCLFVCVWLCMCLCGVCVFYRDASRTPGCDSLSLSLSLSLSDSPGAVTLARIVDRLFVWSWSPQHHHLITARDKRAQLCSHNRYYYAIYAV